MRALLHTEFAALLARAGVSQAAFARMSGYTPRQVNNWCRGRAVVPLWAVALAAILDEHSPDAIEMMVDEARLQLARDPRRAARRRRGRGPARHDQAGPSPTTRTKAARNSR